MKTLMATSAIISILAAGSAFASAPNFPELSERPSDIEEIDHCFFIASDPDVLYVLKDDLECGFGASKEQLATYEEVFPQDGTLPIIPIPAVVVVNGAQVDMRGFEIEGNNVFDVGIVMVGEGNAVYSTYGRIDHLPVGDEAELEGFARRGIVAVGDGNIVRGIEVEESDVCFQVIGDDNRFIDNIAEACSDAGFLLGLTPEETKIFKRPLTATGNHFRLNTAVSGDIIPDVNDFDPEQFPTLPGIVGDGFVVTTSNDDCGFLPGFNVFYRNVAEFRDHGFLAYNSVGNVFLNNFASINLEGFEIEFDLRKENTDDPLFLNALLLNNATRNVVGIRLENSFSALVFDNLSKENSRFDLRGSLGTCVFNTWLYNHAENDNVLPACTLAPASKMDEAAAEAVSKFQSLAFAK